MNPEEKRAYLRTLRYAVQFAFLAITVYAGYRFFGFVRAYEVYGSTDIERPASVDGFLPIAGLMSFKYFLHTGTVEPFHPAAFFIFVAALAVSLLAKKGFCGWICPVGTVSQYVWMAGEKAFGRNFRIEKYTDIGLRMIKYALMGFFIAFIGIAMAPNMMVLFFLSDYYKVADVKTMQFFTEMSSTAFWSLAVIGAGSLLTKNFWCRYLCPYGALLGLLSKASPLKVKRDAGRCIQCGTCTRSCPSRIAVQETSVVSSAECFGCLTCVSRCPAPGALEMTYPARQGRKAMHPALLPVILVAVFYLFIGTAIALGKWQSAISAEEYSRIIPKASLLRH